MQNLCNTHSTYIIERNFTLTFRDISLTYINISEYILENNVLYKYHNQFHHRNFYDWSVGLKYSLMRIPEEFFLFSFLLQKYIFKRYVDYLY
jgi:hypothetical protein